MATLPLRNGSPATHLGFEKENLNHHGCWVSAKKKKKKIVRVFEGLKGSAGSTRVLGETIHLDSSVPEERVSRVSKKGDSDSYICLDSEEESAPREVAKSKSSQLWSFKNGDIVWAKAFPYTWWPGWIDSSKGSRALVSFFGCERTRWFRKSEIRGFEENFPQISKMVGVMLSDEISLALEELNQRTVLGLTCPCMASGGDVNNLSTSQITKVKKGIKSTEMLGFVLDMAVSAWVDDTETARSVRLAAQVTAYRRFISRNDEVKEGFHPAGMLDFVLKMAVSGGVYDEGTSSVTKEVAQLNVYRDFVSICPNWVSQKMMGLGDSSTSDDSEGSHLEMLSDASSDSEIMHGVIREPADDFSVKTQEGYYEIFQEPVQEDKDICVMNRVDFSFFDSNVEYESLLDNQSEDVADQTSLVGVAFCSDENLEKQNLCTSNSLQESGMEATQNFSYVRDVNKTAAFETELQVIEGSVCPEPCNDINHLHEEIAKFSGKDLVCSSISVTTSETERLKQQGDFTTADEHKVSSSAVLPASSHASCLLKTTQCLKAQLHLDLANKCRTHCPQKMLRHDIKFQPSANVNLVANNIDNVSETRSMKIISSIVSSNISVEKWLQKRRLDQPTSSNKSKLPKSKPLCSEAISYASPLPIRLSSTGHKAHSIDEVIHANDSTIKDLFQGNSGAMKFQSSNKACVAAYRSNEKSDGKKVSCSFTLPISVSTSTSKRMKRLGEPVASDLSKWRRLYASPLTMDNSNSTGKPRMSLATARHNSVPKSLHMKFPKDFNLPSKEELEKKFGVFGPVDRSRTRVFFYTGAGQVVFLRQADAYAAYNYVRKKNVFAGASVRFWLDEHENYRKGNPIRGLSVPIVGKSSLNLKSCLKSPNVLLGSDEKKKGRVSFATKG